MANKVTVTIGHEGQLGDDIVGLDQGVEKRDLGRYLVGGVNSSERLRMYLAHPVRVGGLASSNQHVEMLTGDFERRYLGFRVLATVPRRSGSSWSPHYPWGVDVAWRWIVSGVLAIGVGLAVWPTTFILVPAGVVFVAIGVTKWVRSIWATHSRSR